MNCLKHVTENHFTKKISKNILTYHCNKCSDNFKVLSEIHSHVLHVHEPNKLINCEYCDKRFATKQSKQSHIKLVHLKQPSHRPLTCENCGLKFPNGKKDVLETHMIIKHGTGQKDFQCDDCGKSFHTLKKLYDHKTRSHVEKVQCDICSEWFGTRGIMEHHKDLAHGKNVLNCSHCEKCFTSEIRLKNHFKHAHIRPHKCTECDFSTSAQSSLERHVAVLHSGERPCKCEKCGDSFPIEEYLNNHMKNSHDKTRPFVCSICEKTFNSKEGEKGLDNHVARFHEMRNVENCPFCGKQYSRLEAHSLRCNANPNLKRKIYECPNCSKTYQEKSSLNKHMKDKH